MSSGTPKPDGLNDPADLLRALESAAGQAQWAPLFSDDFSRTSLGDDWKIIGGQARVENGWLRLSGRGDTYAVIRRAFPDNVRLEFDARFPAGQPRSSDLACFLGGDERRCDGAGYCLSLGANENTCSRIQREGIDVRINVDRVAERGKVYHLAAEMLEGELRLEVDGQTVVRYVDLVPLAGVGHDHLGLTTYSFGAEFSNIKVLTRSGPAAAGVFTIPDAYCRDGLYDRAIDKYRQVAAAHPEEALALQAQTKVGLALFAMGNYGEAEAQFRALTTRSRGGEMQLLIELWRGLALGMMGKLDEALRVFAQVQSQTTDSGVIDEVAVACGRLCRHLRNEERWIEAGRCAKFLFENLKTPLIETSHMFHVYGGRLHDAAFFDEEYHAVKRLGQAQSARLSVGDLDIKFRTIMAALQSGRHDEARALQSEMEEYARSRADENLLLRATTVHSILDMAFGKYERALERIAPLTGKTQEELRVGDHRWGMTCADLRATALALQGRMDEPLEDLEAGRISGDTLDLRLVLAAELRARGHAAAARSCLSELRENSISFSANFCEHAIPALLGDSPIEPLREYVESSLQPVLQPLGFFIVGLAIWAGGDADAAVLAWAEAKNDSPEFDPAWHWSSLYLNRLSK